MSRVVLTAGTVVAGGVVHRAGWIELDGDRVVGVGAGPPPRPADTALDDALVVPGFVDLHVHGGGGASFTTGAVDEARAVVAAHRGHGTTTTVASLVSADPVALRRQLAALADLVEEGELTGIHLEGPWLSPKRRGAHDPTALRAPDLAEVRALIRAGRGALRMVTLAPELPGALEAIRLLVDSGVVVAVGHTEATYRQTTAAVAAGASVATHLFNAMRPIDHREPGPITALMEDPRVTVEVVLDGVHLHPAVYRQVLAAVGSDRVALVTDAMAAAGMPDGDYSLGTLPVTVRWAVATVAGSTTIAGSTATTDALFRAAVQAAGGPTDEALLAAVAQTSGVPARVLGLPCGDLNEGSRADLVVLSPDLVPERVMRAGEWVRAPADAVAGRRPS